MYDTWEQVLEALARIDQLSDDELNELQAAIAAQFSAAADQEPPTAESIALMQQLADARTTVEGENASRAEAGTALADQRQALIDSFDAPPATDEPPAEQAASARPSPVPLSRLPQQRPTRRSTSAGPRVLTAAGMPLHGRRGVAEAFADALHDVRGMDGEFRTRVARSEWSYPERRTLTADDATRNGELIAAATQPNELVAAGGLCAPAMPYYAIDTFAVADRPIRDSLTQLGAPRGAVTFTPPPKLSDVAGGVSTWTIANDAAASVGTPTKPRLRIACPTPTTVDVQAVPASFEFGNFAGRYYPEWVDSVLATAAAVQARVAESALLTAMNAAATSVTSAQVAGATRDLLVCIERAAAGLRSRQRMRDDATLQVWLPAWSRSLMRSDLARQLATDSADDNGGALAVTDAEIANWFAVRHLIPTWHLEQQIGTQNAGALIAYPGTVEVTIAPPGSFLFLDGGRLDIGLYRDTSLVGTNDYGTFFETFEAVGFIGVEALHPHRDGDAERRELGNHRSGCVTLGLRALARPRPCISPRALLLSTQVAGGHRSRSTPRRRRGRQRAIPSPTVPGAIGRQSGRPLRPRGRHGAGHHSAGQGPASLRRSGQPPTDGVGRASYRP